MDTLELDDRLREMGFQPGNYSIGVEWENALTLLLEDHIWKVFFFERGQRIEEQHFDTEDDACLYVLKLIQSWEGKFIKGCP